jgi:hypothetical protein
MALGDGIRRNIAYVDPAERALLRDALKAINHRYFPGSRNDPIPGGVSWWFKQDEIHQGTHVHNGPEFVPWHREIVNRLEAMIREINPQLSLHYWDWTQDPTDIPDGNLGGGNIGTLNLFTDDFMGYGGSSSAPIGDPWEDAGYYVSGADPHRDDSGNPADPPQVVNRRVSGSPATQAQDDAIVAAPDFPTMRQLLEGVHNAMHGFVNMGGQHISFRDPFVFLLHSNVDRLYAKWQTEPGHPERIDPAFVYGSESAALQTDVEPWSGGIGIRPWAAPENQSEPHTYKHPTLVFPPCYDTNGSGIPLVQVMNAGTPPVIHFNDVPEGETTVRAAVFRVYGCGDVTLRVKAGAGPAAPFSLLQPASGELTVHHGPSLFAEARLWLAFTAGDAGVAVPDGSVTFECPQNGKEFTFVLKADAIERPSVAVMLALDQSGSMDWQAGTSGARRIDVLKDAARKFMELIQAGNGVGLIRFDHDSYPVNHATYPGLPVTHITGNGAFDAGRVAAISAVNSHTVNIAGNTSVGDGVERARQVLDALPAGAYDHKALIVLTDGLENEPAWIQDVAGSIDERTFAIGLGNQSQVNTAALDALTSNTGGYLLLTGLLSSSIDDYFRLSKYFLQILAGVTNNSIVLDPNGYVAPGAQVRLPFHLNEADIDCTAILMTDHNVVDFALEAPDGTRIDAAGATSLGIGYNVGTQTRSYRFTLPAAIGAGQHGGTWHALLTIDRKELKQLLPRLRERDPAAFQALATHGARYSVAIHSYSNLRFAARAEQDAYGPGATVRFAAELSEYGLSVEKRAQLVLELTRPGGAQQSLAMEETAPGQFQADVVAATPGVYHGRVVAKGVTLRGTPFTREQLVTAGVWRGGEQPYQPPRDASGDERCRTLACLLGPEVIGRELEQRLRALGLDLAKLRHCLSKARVTPKEKSGKRRG